MSFPDFLNASGGRQCFDSDYNREEKRRRKKSDGDTRRTKNGCGHKEEVTENIYLISQAELVQLKVRHH